MREGSSRRGKEWKVKLEGSRHRSRQRNKETSSWGTINDSLGTEKGYEREERSGRANEQG